MPLGSGSGTTPGAGRIGGTGSGVGSTDLNTGNEGFGQNTGLDESLDARNKAENREIFASDTIYFDFDKSNVKSEYTANITKVADYLKANSNAALLVEGHCDERGTPEYNLSLGERRALAIREKLMAAGVSGDRVTTISYGEEKPAMLGNSEADYAKNRRGVFVLLLPPTGGSVQ